MSFETPPPKDRLANIQSLRGIAALLVVVAHLLVIESKYSPDRILPKFTELGMVGVDLFFVISGFIMVHVVQNARRGPKLAGEFLFARIARIYPLYWLISAAVLVVYLWRPDMVFSSYDQPPNLWRSFFLYPDVRHPLLAVGWTLVHEMGFYLIFALTLLLKPRWLLPFLAAWAIVLGAGQYANIGDTPLSAVLFSPLSYEFLLGGLTGWLFHRFNAKYAKSVLIVGIILWGVTLAMLISANSGMITNHWGRVIHFALPSVLTIYGLAGLKTQLPKWSQTLGDWSYSLYLTHILTLALFGRVWQKFATNQIWDNVIILPLLVLTSVFVAGLVWKLAEKPLLMLAKTSRGRVFPRPPS